MVNDKDTTELFESIFAFVNGKEASDEDVFDKEADDDNDIESVEDVNTQTEPKKTAKAPNFSVEDVLGSEAGLQGIFDTINKSASLWSPLVADVVYGVITDCETLNGNKSI